MKIRLLFLLVTVLISSLAVSAQSNLSLPRIHVQGNAFVSANGDTLVFRGLNCSDPDKLDAEAAWRAFVDFRKWRDLVFCLALGCLEGSGK